MDKKTALIFKEQCVGTYSGHMANVPFSPAVQSIYNTYMADNYSDKDLFLEFLEEVVAALKDKADEN
jgi:hypothetical protein